MDSEVSGKGKGGIEEYKGPRVSTLAADDGGKVVALRNEIVRGNPKALERGLLLHDIGTSGQWKGLFQSDEERQHYVAAEENGKLIAAMGARYVPNDREKGIVRISSLFLSPAGKDVRIMEKLLQQLSNTMKSESSAKKLRVTLPVTESDVIKILESLKFNQIEESGTSEDGADTHDTSTATVVLEKHL